MRRHGPGRFLGLRMTLPARLEETAVAAFWEAGCLGVETISASRTRLEPRVSLRVYFPGAQPQRPLAARVAGLLRKAGLRLARPPRLAAVRDRRWAEIWQRSLKPMRIGRRILVVPEGCRTPASRSRIAIHVRFGQAFGTGEHASTRACLRLMEGCLSPGDRVADLGTGTVILAMAAARLGAGRVVAVDQDDVALRVGAENLADNALEGRIELMRGDASAAFDFGPYDLILVNIGAAAILRLLPGVAGALAPGGRAILAGFLIEDELPLQRRAAACGLRLERGLRSRPWSALLLRNGGASSRGKTGRRSP
jgi:ribosomal protein L11 methyltransferase